MNLVWSWKRSQTSKNHYKPITIQIYQHQPQEASWSSRSQASESLQIYQNQSQDISWSWNRSQTWRINKILWRLSGGLLELESLSGSIQSQDSLQIHQVSGLNEIQQYQPLGECYCGIEIKTLNMNQHAKETEVIERKSEPKPWTLSKQANTAHWFRGHLGFGEAAAVGWSPNMLLLLVLVNVYYFHSFLCLLAMLLFVFFVNVQRFYCFLPPYSCWVPKAPPRMSMAP